MELILPNNYVDLEQEEMMYLDGGEPMSISAIVALAITIGGASYSTGYVLGERVYYSGYKNSDYQKNKWGIRGAMLAVFGAIGAVVMLGFENRYYALVTGRG
ncbi:Membrane protein [Streptococcus pneumoniae]|nr:Membrane protein [Streptococcus pneumoniae]